MIKIQLNRHEWVYDPHSRLGVRGGFGQVFIGANSNGQEVAIKKLNLSAHSAAHREMRIADELIGMELDNIIKIFDSGEDASSGSYFLVMEKAQKSLQDEIDGNNKNNENDALSILLEIVEGMLQVSKMIHRDLKPDNILFHDNKWKIADFGIAKFVENSTSMNTLKGCLSAQYAAPEQWNLQQVSHETDVYAIGCIGYALLTGNPPFIASTKEEYKKQHLENPPPDLPNVSPPIRSLLLMMLRKNPDARPSMKRVRQRVSQILEEHQRNIRKVESSLLQKADANVARSVSEREAADATLATKRNARVSLSNEAYYIFDKLYKKLFERIVHAAPNTTKEAETTLRLGEAFLEVSSLENFNLHDISFPQSKWDIIAGAKILVRQKSPQYVWSSSLWYTNLGGDAGYRWYEVSYMFSPLLTHECPYQPFFLTDFSEVDVAASSVIGTHQIAFGPILIDDENEEDFFFRWEDLLAKAVEGKICYPSRLPLIGKKDEQE